MSSPISDERYALTAVQQGMLFHRVQAPASGVDIEQMVATLREPIDVEQLQQAWQIVTDLHGALRTRVIWEGLRSPAQEVLPRLEVRLDVQDASTLPEPEQRVQLTEFLRRDRVRGIDLAQAPAVSAAAVSLRELGLSADLDISALAAGRRVVPDRRARFVHRVRCTAPRRDARAVSSHPLHATRALARARGAQQSGRRGALLSHAARPASPRRTSCAQRCFKTLPSRPVAGCRGLRSTARSKPGCLSSGPTGCALCRDNTA